MLQEETMVLSRFRMSDISKATERFSERFLIGFHEYGKVYKAELDDFENKSSLPFKEKNDGKWQKRRTSVAIKCFSSSVDVKQRFFSEIVMRTSYKHPNIVSLLGFCDEGDELILVYEHASNNSLHNYVKNVDKMGNLTWRQRLHMCLGIAHGLNGLHTKMGSQQRTIHGDIRSANILLGKNLEPKIAYFGISKFHLAYQEESSRQVYWDPEFEKSSLIKKESDIYSFGVTLFEIFCGTLANDPYYTIADPKGLVPYAWSHFNNKSIQKLIDPKLFKKAIDDDILTSNIRGPNLDSVDTFLKIAYQCVKETQAKRPSMETLIKQLEIALDFQVSQYFGSIPFSLLFRF
ncbi:putative protein kinase RLK-Pelle-DLSV family [Helianthus annuus]|nr:putative protein kinase RLK-Pelle-DLSV family [Helianthus annuus]KAJ0687609.1 putative protein kinase RLK-Pelle-DLSV family [Helianthus annuus]KAJ0873148.1 putative protein kinase RLK-Pelle-DLSV family [Helianthus annuus]